METRIFDRPVTALSADGQHSEVFNRGERVKEHQAHPSTRYVPSREHTPRSSHLRDGLD